MANKTLPGQRGFGTGAGRKKGQLDHRALEFQERLAAACKKHKVDLIEGMVTLCKPCEDPDIRIRASRELLKYAYPALKAVEYKDKGSMSRPRVVIIRSDDVESVTAPSQPDSEAPKIDAPKPRPVTRRRRTNGGRESLDA